MPKPRRIEQVAIPTPYENLGALYRTSVATKELVEVLAGQRGDRDDQAVTWADMPKPTVPAPVPPAPETWHPIPFVNAWTEYGAPYTPAGYRKLDSGLVILKGLISGGSAAHMCTLPAGYRPGVQLLLVAYTNPNVACRLDVMTNGQISHTGGSAPWVSLSNICFFAEN